MLHVLSLQSILSIPEELTKNVENYEALTDENIEEIEIVIFARRNNITETDTSSYPPKKHVLSLLLEEN
ncbi:10746_t:CDS:2 [Diversispora eburnea]|uniref:10746_t:CDS:1 n=1 Tax=Diversispora eburnea TaxID=1213867 RepID=A0A9N9FVI3_9GLOM|nr:10746_t:CDS:2 [Diversispora eburnea]